MISPSQSCHSITVNCPPHTFMAPKTEFSIPLQKTVNVVTLQAEQLRGLHHWEGGSAAAFKEALLAIWITPKGIWRYMCNWWTTFLPSIKEYHRDTSTLHDRHSGGCKGHWGLVLRVTPYCAWRRQGLAQVADFSVLTKSNACSILTQSSSY